MGWGKIPISVDSTRLNSQARFKKAPGAASKWKATNLDMESEGENSGRYIFVARNLWNNMVDDIYLLMAEIRRSLTS